MIKLAIMWSGKEKGCKEIHGYSGFVFKYEPVALPADSWPSYHNELAKRSLILLVLGLLTIASQTLRAAKTKTVDALKMDG